MHYNSVFSLNPGINRAVFLSAVSVDGLTLTDVPLLRNKVYAIMEEELVKWKAAWINNAKELEKN